MMNLGENMGEEVEKKNMFYYLLLIRNIKGSHGYQNTDKDKLLDTY